MRLKQVLASILAGACALTLCACGTREVPPPTQNEYVVTQDTISELFNSAVQKLNEADSYTMTGSVTSVAEIAASEVLTTVRVPLECRYQEGKMFFDSDNSNDPHTLYFDGEIYYYCIEDTNSTIKYFGTANDHNDYSAADYLLPIDAEIVLNPSLSVNDDGTQELSFSIPFAIYESPALIGWLGFVVDESHAANLLNVFATVDADGYFTAFSFSFVNDTDFGDLIHQEIAVGMTLSNYNSTVITAPSDIQAYEDWTDPDVPESTHGMEEIPPEDLG